MDFFVKHWAAFPRRFPLPCQVLSIGDIKGKNHHVKRSFNTCNFSFILKGRGTFCRKNQVWPIQAPFMLTQWPKEPLLYGPIVPDETWDELYLIYDAKCMSWFRQRGFVNESRPVWPIQNLSGVMAQVQELRALLLGQFPEAIVDRVDRICERLILESLLPDEIAVGPQIGDAVIQAIVRRLQRDYRKPHDFDQTARGLGLSSSTLRRRWYSALNTTPGRYLLDLRIQRARQLLVESALPVGEIAAQTGFEDVLYFSRRFKLETALTPSQYRRRHAPHRSSSKLIRVDP